MDSLKSRRSEGNIQWRGRDCRAAGHKHSGCAFRVRAFDGIDPASGKPRVAVARGRGNQREAERALRDLLARRDARTYAPERKTTVGQWVESWLADRIADGKVGPRAGENYWTIVRKRIVPRLGRYPLSTLRADHVIEFKTALVEEGLAPATVGKILGLLRQSLEAAILAGLLPRNPAQGVPRPSVAAVTAERRALDEDEVSSLLAAARRTPLDTAIRFALATGVRQSEQLGARWEDVDSTRSTFTVQQTLQHVGGGFRSLSPKTTNSRRVIELSAATLRLLRQHRLGQHEERLRLGAIWQDEDLVFPAADGRPQYRRELYRDYRAVVSAAGIARPESVNWHMLRHTAASLWLKAGVDVFVVSRRLGHANPGFTMRVYSHLLPGQQKAAAEALDHLLAR